MKQLMLILQMFLNFKRLPFMKFYICTVIFMGHGVFVVYLKFLLTQVVITDHFPTPNS